MQHAIILAGGSGKRFWPLSRTASPKPFIPLIDQKTLFDLTIERLDRLVPEANLWVVVGASHAHHLNLFRANHPQANILVEPASRNTAPSIGWAAAEIAEIDPDAIITVLPSDHWIAPHHLFQDTLTTLGNEAAAHDALFTIGILPHKPHTGYGYIQTDDLVLGALTHAVIGFTEKPDFETAVRFIQDGHHYWNSGIFVWKASVLLERLRDLAPDIYNAVLTLPTLRKTRDEAAIRSAYQGMRSESIDCAVMENSAHLTRMVVARFQWSDIGSWTVLPDHLPTDEEGNFSNGPLITENAVGNVTYSTGKTIALLDVSNLIVIETEDAILVTPKSSGQKLSAFVENLPQGLK